MIIETRIFPDGKVVTEVLDRQNHMCGEIYRVTARMGQLVSDEELPDCAPTQHEVSSD
jgi:hypothetical protein